MNIEFPDPAVNAPIPKPNIHYRLIYIHPACHYCFSKNSQLHPSDKYGPRWNQPIVITESILFDTLMHKIKLKNQSFANRGVSLLKIMGQDQTVAAQRTSFDSISS